MRRMRTKETEEESKEEKEVDQAPYLAKIAVAGRGAIY